MTRRTRRAHAAPRPLSGESPAEAPEPTRAHTGRDPADERAESPIQSLFGQIASLHGQLAHAYEDLAEETGIALADLARQSVHAARMSPPPTAVRARSARAMLKPREAAELLDYHPRTLRRLELEGVLPQAVGTGRLKRWRRSDLEQWEAEGRPGA